ncbi:hypothetical protein Tco_0123510 [Tanacetum coccineum]
MFLSNRKNVLSKRKNVFIEEKECFVEEKECFGEEKECFRQREMESVLTNVVKRLEYGFSNMAFNVNEEQQAVVAKQKE